MSHLLNPDDFEIGMKITVHTGSNRPIPLRDQMSGDVVIGIHLEEDTAFKGEIIEIINILLPYIVVRQHSKWKHAHGEVSKLDTRGRKFMRVTPEYEAALLSDKNE